MKEKFLFTSTCYDNVFDGCDNVVVELNFSQKQLMDWLHSYGVFDEVLEYRSLDNNIVTFREEE